MPQKKKTFRLVMRSDFDSLLCAVLLRKLDMIHEHKLATPKEIQSGSLPISNGDIMVNLPYSPNSYISFDPFEAEAQKNYEQLPDNLITGSNAPSTSRLIYNHFGGAERFPEIPEHMLVATDKANRAQFSVEEILNPEDWLLLHFILDPRTRLNRFENFAATHGVFIEEVIAGCLAGRSAGEILAGPMAERRVATYLDHREKYIYQLHRCTSLFRNLLVVHFYQERTIFSGNRFVVFALFPQCNIGVQMSPGHSPATTSFGVGKSIINRSSRTHIGDLMTKYGGGGHEAVGACEVPDEKRYKVLKELIYKINKDG